METKITPVESYQRKYLKKDSNYRQWASLSEFAKELIDQTIDSTEDLLNFLYKKNELDVVVREQMATYYLETSRFVNARDDDPTSKQIAEELQANKDKTTGILMKKILNSPFLGDLLKTKPELRQMILNIQNNHKIYTEKNESVIARLNELKNQYKKINAQHKILVNGEEMILHKAGPAVKDAPRSKRIETALAVEDCHEKHSETLDEIFDEMVEKRHLKATQAGYQNFVDYTWTEWSRIDYRPKDCRNVCSAIETHFIPIYKEVFEKRKQFLGLKEAFLFDLYSDLGNAPAPVFPKTQEEFCSKLKQVFKSIHPDFAEAFDYLIEKDRLDFEARSNKVTAMFMMYFPEQRLPFIFYMPVNTVYDVHGTIHEVTHGIHSMYYNQYSLLGLQHPGAEVAELFTLSMELISLDYWGVYFEDRQNLIRAKLKKLENCLGLLRMVGLWDTFQQWAYLHPDHTRKERNLYWDDLSKRYDFGITPIKSIPAAENTGWQRRPLIYSHPFYMIEYAFAQFGAFEIYRQYRESPTQTMNNLIAAMKLGNTRSIQETYQTAGVQFDFSDATVKTSAKFLSTEYNRLFEQLEF